MSYATIARIDEGATGSRDGILDGAGILLAADGAERVGGGLKGRSVRYTGARKRIRKIVQTAW